MAHITLMRLIKQYLKMELKLLAKHQAMLKALRELSIKYQQKIEPEMLLATKIKYSRKQYMIQTFFLTKRC